MTQASTDVLVAGYQNIESATTDFDKLMQLVRTKKVKIEGAILVTHDKDGNVTVAQHGDHLGRKGAGWGAGVGLAVGLFAPAMLPAIAVGAAAGGLAGKFADHKLKSGIGDKIGENLPAGSAGIITVFDEEYQLVIEQTLAGSPMKSVVETDKKGVAALKDELATAMGKFSPDRTVLPIPDKTFGGTMGHTLDTSAADWSFIPVRRRPTKHPTC